MKRLQFSLAVLVAVGLTIASGVIHGRMTNRWGVQIDTVAAANRLKEIPNEFGDWQLQAAEELDKGALQQLDPAGYVVRRYQNLQTGDVVNVTVLLGRPGPISVHTPEVCLGMQNYEVVGERRKATISAAAGADELWWLDYKVRNLSGDQLRLYYAWSSGGRWQALEDARFWSAGLPYLYKTQLSCVLPPGATNPPSDDPCRKFLQDFVPVARKYLVPPAAK
ncbi:MAG: exosortase-associated EpsI family protein [Thermoguttaceae bacterium]|jgi:hypothetical protein